MKRAASVILAFVLSAVFLVPAGPAAHAAPYCGIYWGSLPERVSVDSWQPTLVNVRAGRHACFDRLVLDFRGDIVSYDVRYGRIVQDGSGLVIPVRGGADLSIVATATAHDANGNSTVRLPANRLELLNVNGYRTFRQVAYAGEFEGLTTVGLGVRARLPFRVFVLDGPGDMSRLVVDVAHRW
jgi:hypothetical protein